MNELEASTYARQFATRWPGRLQVQVEAPSHRDDGNGYVVQLIIPRYNRILRLTRDAQFDGLQNVCSVLLGEQIPTRERNMQQTPGTAGTLPNTPETSTASDRPKRPYRRSLTPEKAELVSETVQPTISPVGETQILQALIAYVFTSVPGVIGLGCLSEVPRTWKIDATTEHGLESYRLTRNVDGSFRQERW